MKKNTGFPNVCQGRKIEKKHDDLSKDLEDKYLLNLQKI